MTGNHLENGGPMFESDFLTSLFRNPLETNIGEMRIRN